MSTSRPRPPEPAVKTLAKHELRLKDGRYLIVYGDVTPRKPDA